MKNNASAVGEGTSVWTAATLQAREAVGKPVAPPRRRPRTISWPGQELGAVSEDRCYEFVRQCGGNRARITDRRLEALATLWAFMHAMARQPGGPARSTDGDALIGGTSLDAVLSIALPGACGSRRAERGLPPAVDTPTIVDTCAALLASPPPAGELAARLHTVWLKVHFAMADSAAPAEADYLMLGRVAALLNPSLGGLTAAYLPDAGVDETLRDRVDLMVAHIAMTVFTMLTCDETVRRVAYQYLVGNHISGGTDPGRAETARFSESLEAAQEHPTYERTDRVSREAYERSLVKVMGDRSESERASADFRRWREVTADVLTRLPLDFTCSQAESLATVMAAVIDAVHSVQPQPHWGEGPVNATAAVYAVSTLGSGATFVKQHLTARLFAYYISIEKGKDLTKGAFHECTPHPDPTLDAGYLAALTAGWHPAARNEWLKVHAQTARVRPTTLCRDWAPAPVHSTEPNTGFTPGPNYRNYVSDRMFDGFWHVVEAYRQGELGGPLRLLEEPDYWTMIEAGVWAGELAFIHRRKFEDGGHGIMRHLSGPAEGRATWGLRRLLDLYLSRSRAGGPDLLGHCATDACLWMLYLCFPGCVSWYNLPQGSGGAIPTG